MIEAKDIMREIDLGVAIGELGEQSVAWKCDHGIDPWELRQAAEAMVSSEFEYKHTFGEPLVEGVIRAIRPRLSAGQREQVAGVLIDYFEVAFVAGVACGRKHEPPGGPVA